MRLRRGRCRNLSSGSGNDQPLKRAMLKRGGQARASKRMERAVTVMRSFLLAGLASALRKYFHLNEFASVDELKTGLARYIRYYNHDRIKLKLKGLSPVQYRTQPSGA